MSGMPEDVQAKSGSAVESTTWAITAYFNPIGYRRRLDNYRYFHEHLALPLMTVEFGLHGQFDLVAEDAESLIQLDGPDVLWQRERLLNVAISRLPTDVTKVVWLDCDAVFEDDQWVERMDRTLDEYPIAQAFSEVVLLPETERSELRHEFRSLEGRPSLCSHIGARQDLRSVCSDLPCQSNRVFPGPTGLGWAFRREVIETLGLYDVCVLGGGDLLFVSALAGCFDRGIEYHQMTDVAREHYLQWADSLFASVGLEVGCVPARVYHLWHGEVGNRGYQSRYQNFGRFGFDPRADLTCGSNGVWEWASDKPGFHRFVEGYFIGRREDG